LPYNSTRASFERAANIRWRDKCKICARAPCGRNTLIGKPKPGKYRLYSRKKNPKTGKRRNLGTFKTKTAAKKRESAIQYFKWRNLGLLLLRAPPRLATFWSVALLRRFVIVILQGRRKASDTLKQCALQNAKREMCASCDEILQSGGSGGANSAGLIKLPCMFQTVVL
jgi:hypothetical protein